MGKRLLPVALVVLGALADSHGSSAVARDCLLAALPFAAVAALVVFGEFLESREDTVLGLQSLLWGVVVCLLVLSSALRSTAIHTIPPLAVSSLVACVAIFAVKGLLAAAPYARRLGLMRTAKP